MDPIVSFFVITIIVFTLPVVLLRFGKEFLIGLFPIYSIIGFVFSKSYFTFSEDLEQSLAVPIYGGTFLITDLLSEHFGRKEAVQGVWMGLVGQILFLLVILIVLNSNIHPEYYDSYRGTFSRMPQFVIGSILAFAVSQFLDIFIYHKFLSVTGRERGLFLRNNLSTGISQFVYTAILMCIGFWGIPPYETLGKLGTFIILSWALKVLLALLDYPFIYFSTRLYPLAPEEGDEHPSPGH